MLNNQKNNYDNLHFAGIIQNLEGKMEGLWEYESACKRSDQNHFLLRVKGEQVL